MAVLVVAVAKGESELQAPVQPIPFSHRQHEVAAKLKCADCHGLGEEGDIETFPKAKSCLNCHRTVSSDTASIRTLAHYSESNRPIPWVRVYEIPAFVNFSHKVHAEAGTNCQTCHGPVGERDRLWREVDTSMSNCVACHQAHQAPVDCGVCHALQH